MKIRHLKSNRILLRKLKVSDANDISKNIRDKDVRKWLTLGSIKPYTKNGAIKFIKEINKYTRQKKGYILGLF